MNKIRPVSLVLAVLVSSLAVVPSALAQTPPFDRTVLVGGSGTPAVNGANLLAALAGITTNSATNPWLIRVEPGVFDLQGASLVMKDFVDIEGSGRDVTYIQSTVATETAGTVNVPANVNAELRDLTVQNFSETSGAAVRNASSFLLLTQVNLEVATRQDAIGLSSVNNQGRVSEVFIRLASKQANTFGVNIRSGGPVISETFVFIDSDGSNNTGWSIGEGAFPTLLEIRAQVRGAVRNNIGVSVFAGKPTIQNCNVSATGDPQSGNTAAFQIQRESTVVLKDCLATGTSGRQAAGMVASSNSTVFANESSFVGVQGLATSVLATATGVFNSGATLQFDRCTVEGQTNSINSAANTSSTLFGASRLVGRVSNVLGATLSCAQSYNGLNADLNASCL